MSAAVGGYGARVLATMAALGGLAACTFEALGQGATPHGLSTTGGDPGSTGSSASTPTSETAETPDATSGSLDTTLDPPSTDSGDSGTETGEPRPERPSGPFGRAEPVPERAVLAYRLVLDEYNGRQRVQMVVEGLVERA